MEVDDGFHFLLGICTSIELTCEPLVDLFKSNLEEGDEDIVFTFKVKVDRTVTNAGASRNV